MPQDDLDEFVTRYTKRKVDEEAQKQGVPVDLARQVANTESSFRPDVINGQRKSSKGAIGTMQLMPGTAKEMGVDPNHIGQNIEGGVKYLKKQLDTFGDPAKAAAAYNAGPGAVQKYGGTPPYAETQNYVQKVTGGAPSDDIDEFVSRYKASSPTPGDKPAPLVRVPKTDRKGPVLQKPLPSPFGLQTGADIVGQAQGVTAPLKGSERLAKREAINTGLSQLREEGRQRGQTLGKAARFTLGAGEQVARLGAGLASIPGRVGALTTGQRYDAENADTANKLTALAEYMGGAANPDDSIFSAGGLGQAAGMVATGLGPGKVAGKLAPGAGLASTVTRGAISGGGTMGALSAGQPVSNAEIARQAVGGAVGGVAGDVAGKLAAPVVGKIGNRVLRGAAQLGGASTAGALGNVAQTAAMGDTDAASLKKAAIAGAALGAVPGLGQIGQERAIRKAQIAAIKQEPLRAPSDIRPTTTGPTQITKIPQNQPEPTMGGNGPVSSNPEPILAEGVELPPEWVNAQRGELAQMMGVQPEQKPAILPKTLPAQPRPLAEALAPTPATNPAPKPAPKPSAAEARAARQAQLESDRATMFETARSLADESGARADEHFQAGRFGDAAAELTTQQSQIKEAIRNLPKTPEGLKTKSELTRQLGMIGNRLGEVRRASRGKSTSQPSQSAATTPSEASNQTVRAEPLLESVVNPEGGIPENAPIKSTPGADFERLAAKAKGPTEDTSDLLTEIRRAGGIADDGDTSGELRRLGLKEGQTTGIVNNKSGVSVDDMRAMMKSEGHSNAETVADFYNEMEDALRAKQKQAQRPQVTEEEHDARKMAEPAPKPTLDPLADPDARRLIAQAKTGEPGAVKRAYDELGLAYGLSKADVDHLTAPPEVPTDLMTRTRPAEEPYLPGLSEEEQRNIGRMKGPELDAYLKRLEAERNAGIMGADTGAEEGFQQSRAMALANKERHARVMAGEMAPKQPKLPAPGHIAKAERAAEVVKPIEEQKPPRQEWRASGMRETGSSRITYEDVTKLTDDQLAKRIQDYGKLQEYGATMDKGRQDHLDRLQREYAKRQPAQPEITPQEQKTVDRINQSGRPAPAEYWASRGGTDRKTLDSLVERGLLRKTADGRYGPVGVESTSEGAAKRNTAYQETKQEAAAKERADYASLTGDRKAEYDRLRMAGLEHGQAMEQSAKPRTVTHDNPAIDGKPIVGETKDGRVVVANPENKSGVSIVKNKGAQSVADVVKAEKPGGGLVSIAKLRERGLSDADILAASERGEISLQRGEPRINRPSELLDDGQGNKYVGASVRETPNEGVLIRGEVPVKEETGAKFKAGDSVTWKSGKMELKGKVQGYDRKGNLMIRDEIGDTVKVPENQVKQFEDKPQFVKDAEKRLKETLTGQRSGSGGQALVDQAIVTGYKVYKSGMRFADWSAKMVKEMGEEVKPHLEAAWKQVSSVSRRQKVSETLGTAQALAQMGTPGFIARNIIQHFSSGAQALIDQPIASLIDRAVALKTGQRSTVTGNPLTNTAQWVKDYKEGVKAAFKAVREGKALPGARLENVPEEGLTKIGETLGKVLKYINEVPDAGAWNANYKKALRDLVATEKPKLAKMAPEEIVKRQDEIIKQSVIEANRATLKDKNWVSNTAGNVKNLLNKATMPITGTDKFGLGDFVLKYTQIPGAILKRGIEYSPLGIFDAAYKAHEFKGSEFRQREVVNSLARAVTGTGTGVGMGALMSAMGILVAPDPNDKQQWLESEEGKRGFQINMSALKRRAFDMVGSDPETAKLQKGDVLVGIDWLQPWALQASVGATIYDQWKRGKETGIGRAAMDSLGNFISVAQDQTLLNSIQRQWKIAKRAGQDGREFSYEDAVTGVLREIAVGAAPSFMPGLVRQARQVVDPYTRDTRAEIEKGKTPEGKQIRQPWYRQMAAESLNRIKEGIPGVSSGLPTKTSAITGEPRKTAIGEFSAPVRAAKMLLPAPFAQYNPQPVVREIDRLRESGANVSTKFPFPKQDKETDWIEPTRSVRSREQEYAENFARMSKDLIESPVYQQMSDDQKAKAISGLSAKLEKQTWEGKQVNPNKVLMDAQRRHKPRKIAADYLQERD